MDNQIIGTLCRMCDDHCGVNIIKKEDNTFEVKGNPKHPWNKGRLCIKGVKSLDMQFASGRLSKPLKKVNGKFVEISLEVALEEIAKKIENIQQKYGNQSVGVWKGESIGFGQQEELARRWIHAIGSPNYFSCDSACFADRWMGYSLVYGRWNSQPDFENSKCIILWGSNVSVSHPHMTAQIEKARKNGAKLVVVDSRKSVAAKKADLHILLRPGSDGAFALGLIRQLIRENIVDWNFVKKYTIGFEEIRNYANQFDEAYVSNEIGFDVQPYYDELIPYIKESMQETVIYIGHALGHHENGIQNIRSVACLDGILGCVDHKGGNYTPVGFSMKNLTLYDEKPLIELEPIGSERFPVLYDYRQECHTMTLMDTILNDQPYPVKAIVLTGANPVLSNPNTEKVKKALSKLELLVVRDIKMSETAELADYVLPAASFLERSELFVHGRYQNVSLSKCVFEPKDEVQNDYVFFRDLARLLGVGEYFPWQDENELNKWLLSECSIKYEDLVEHPEGIKYADYEDKKYEKAVKPFNTKSGKFEFVSKYLEEKGYDRLPKYHKCHKMEECKEFPYLMTTGARKMKTYGSRNRDIASLLPPSSRASIEIRKSDAYELDVDEGDMVLVSSRIGSLEIPVHIIEDDCAFEHCVEVPHGWKDYNVNSITYDDVFDPISGFPLLKSVLVKIKKIKK